MPDYQKGKIYKIVGGGKTYYGSTCEPTLARRLAKHNSKYKCYQNNKSGYTSSYEILDEPDCAIYLVENYPCSSKDELHAREGYFIQNNDCVNKIKKVHRTKKEKKEYDKQYRDENKELLAVKHKQYREKNKILLATKRKDYIKNNRYKVAEQRRKYREINLSKLNEYEKQYREKNKYIMSEKKKQKYLCECGSQCNISSKARHLKTKKHIDYMNNNTV